MHRFIALAVYACKVAGTPTESIDFRVRVLDAASLEDAKQSLEAEPTGQYRNGDGEVVEWPLALILDK